MTDTELDQLLNRWQAPAPSSGLRRRVLLSFPQTERRSFGRPLRWVLAIMVASCVLAIGMEQSGHTAIENLTRKMHVASQRTKRWVDGMWLSYVMAAFRDSRPKIYVDGELRSDATFGGGAAEGCWVRIPGEGKYYLVMSKYVSRGSVPPVGRFDGRMLQFQAGGRAVRIESGGTFGFGLARLPVYLVLGPRAD